MELTGGIFEITRLQIALVFENGPAVGWFGKRKSDPKYLHPWGPRLFSGEKIRAPSAQVDLLHERPGIRSRILQENVAVIATRAFGGTTVDSSYVVNTDRSGLSAHRHRLREIRTRSCGIDTTVEHAFVGMVFDRSPVATKENHHRATIFVDVIDHDAHHSEIFIRVRVEGPVSVPLKRESIAGNLHV